MRRPLSYGTKIPRIDSASQKSRLGTRVGVLSPLQRTSTRGLNVTRLTFIQSDCGCCQNFVYFKLSGALAEVRLKAIDLDFSRRFGEDITSKLTWRYARSVFFFVLGQLYKINAAFKY